MYGFWRQRPHGDVGIETGKADDGGKGRWDSGQWGPTTVGQLCNCSRRSSTPAAAAAEVKPSSSLLHHWAHFRNRGAANLGLLLMQYFLNMVNCICPHGLILLLAVYITASKASQSTSESDSHFASDIKELCNSSL